MLFLRLIAGAGLLFGLLLTACQSEEVRAKCAATADPASCERAEYARIRDFERRRETERQSGGSGY